MKSSINSKLLDCKNLNILNSEENDIISEEKILKKLELEKSNIEHEIILLENSIADDKEILKKRKNFSRLVTVLVPIILLLVFQCLPLSKFVQIILIITISTLEIIFPIINCTELENEYENKKDKLIKDHRKLDYTIVKIFDKRTKINKLKKKYKEHENELLEIEKYEKILNETYKSDLTCDCYENDNQKKLLKKLK